MNDTLREQMLARAEVMVNRLTSWVDDHPEADLDTRETVVLEHGRALLGDLLALVAGAAGARSPACPRCECGPCGRCGGSGRARCRRGVA